MVIEFKSFFIKIDRFLEKYNISKEGSFKMREISLTLSIFNYR